MASQTITGPDLQYTQDNQRCYAYSGVFANAYPSTYLLFQTGSGLIVAEFYYIYATDAGDNANYIIKLNDIEVFNAFATAATSLTTGVYPVKIVLPPFTKVEATASAASSRKLGFLMTGRVFDYLPVRN